MTIGILLGAALALQAQWRGLRATELGPEQGLSMSVNCVLQDSRGSINIGGSQGLTQYDGSTFTLHAYDPDDTTTIGPGAVYNVIEGEDGRLWFTLRFGGLGCFDPHTQSFRRFPVPELPYSYIPSAHGILMGRNGKIWVGGHHFQLLLFDPETESYTSFSPDWIDPEEYGRRLSITNIIRDVDNPDLLWLSVVDFVHSAGLKRAYGLCTFDLLTGTFTPHPNSGNIRLIDSTGILYGTNVGIGITAYDPDNSSTRIIPLTGIQENYMPRDILPVEDGKWVLSAFAIQNWDGSDGFMPLYQIDRNTGIIFNRLQKDHLENIWICTSHGAHVIDPGNQHIRYFSLEKFGGFSRIYPGRLAYDPNADLVYLANSAVDHRRRLYRIPLTRDFESEATFLELPFDIRGLAMDGDNRLWLAGEQHMYRLENDVAKRISNLGFDHFQMPWLWNMRTSANGWIAGAGIDRFFWFKPTGPAIREVSIDSLDVSADTGPYEKEITGFKFGRNKSSAYIVSGVLHHVDLTSGIITHLKTPGQFNPDGQHLTDVEVDQDGNIWVASVEYTGKFSREGDSLHLIDKFTVRDGFPSVMTHELHMDDHGRMWIFTDNGMAGFDPQTSEIRHFGIEEGLPDIYIDPRQVMTTPDGRIATVNSRGLIVYHPDSLWHSKSPEAVTVVVKEIRVNGTKINNTNILEDSAKIDVPYGSAVIDVAFQGLSYPKADGLRYSYRLGSGSQWIDIGNNKLVTLPALSPGSYVFQVKAGAPESDAPVRSLSLEVPTPFHQQWWFRLLVFIAIAGLIYALYRYRVGRIRREEAEKTAINKQIAELELTALRSQMNPHFMFNSLNSIKDFILQSKPEKAAEYLSDFAHLVRLILQNSREKRITLAEELDALTLYVSLEQLRFEHSFEFHCTVDEGIDLDDFTIPPMLLQPYIENAIWHGLMHKKDKGHLTVRLTRSNGSIHCIIDDDGIGRQRARGLRSLSARKYKSMGMGITGARIDIMNRMDSLGITVEVEDKNDADGNADGTKVTLTIPSTSMNNQQS